MNAAAPLRLVLVRHAETAYNSAGMVQGKADHPLTALGARQAEAAGAVLAREPLDAVYTSPLQRARSTAEAIAAPHALHVRCDGALTEMDIGAMEGLRGPELRARYPEFMAAWLSDAAATTPMPGGESLAQVQTRACAALAGILEAHAQGMVAVVSHNFLLLTLLCYVLDMPLVRFRRLRLHVAGLSMVESRGRALRLTYLNDVCHLERAGLLAADPWLHGR